MSINRAILLGNVGKDPDIRFTQAGDKIATFSLATSETWKDKATGERKETTDWHTIVCFNQPIAGVIEQFVKKGSRVSVEGQIKTRKWQAQDGTDRYSTEIVIGRFDGRLSLEGQPQDARREEGSYGDTRAKPSAQSDNTAGASRAPIDDDIPF
jgi:single-strand DNA-binding protein